MTRNIDIGAIVSKVFETYRQYAGVLLPIAAVLFLIEAVFSYLGIDSTGLALVASLIGIVLSTLYTGMVVELVNDTRDGRLDQSVGGLVRSVGPVILPLIGLSIVVGIAVAIGFILIIVPGLILITIWAVAAPAVVVERKGIFEALGRSRELVKGNGWQVFGVIILFFLIFFVIGLVLGALGAALGDAGQVILGWVGRVATAPLVALAAAILFFELKSSKGETAAVAGPPAGAPIAGFDAPESPSSAPPPPPPAPGV